MTPEEWQKIQEILDSVLLELPEDRLAAVERACGDDPGLAEEVLSLLKAAEAEDTLLDQSRIPLQPHPSASDAADAQVGSYALIRRLGRGGMGEVYLARRTDDVHHKDVAVKLLQMGLETAEMIRRFLREREILAQLEHPHIARLLDGGQTSDGRPYLVMEYVVGTPIDVHCRERTLSLDERLILFAKVCRAIHFAHQNLVVHRDLKPANILVTAEGEPRLLDFGIAKLLDTESFPLTLETTAPGRSPMTPAYASPEQLLGERVTTASDIYSLGVLLYVMLTGQKPFDTHANTPLRHLEAVSTEEPTRPSVAGEDVPWKRHLGGDLDNIVMMALRREPERRYASAEQLAKDLELYRAGKPVIARADTFAYRTSKFVRRNKWAVSATSLALLTLVAFLSVMLRQGLEIRQQAESLAVTSNFLIDLFQNPDPNRTRGEALSAKDLLDRGARDITKNLEDRPQTQAELMIIMGRSYLGLGLFDEAEQLHRQALETFRSLHPGDHEDLARSQRLLATVLSDQGNLEEAESLARQSVAMRERLGSTPQAMAGSLNTLGNVLRRQGRFPEAEAQLLEARNKVESLAAEEAPELRPQILAGLGLIYRQQAKYETSEALFREALARRIELWGEKDLRVTEVMVSLATVLDHQGRHPEAEQLFRRALEIQQEILDGPHPKLVESQGDLAQVLHSQGHFTEAEQAFLSALEMAPEVYGEKHPTEASFLAKLAAVVEDLGRASEAEELARRALTIRRERLGEHHVDTAISSDYLAQILSGSEIGKYAEARELFEEALRIYRRTLEPNHPLIAATLSNLAGLQKRQGEPERATASYRESLRILREVHGDLHPQIVPAAFNFALLLHAEKNRAEAAQHYALAEQAARASLRSDHPTLGILLTHFGRLGAETDDPGGALVKLEEARDILAANYPAGHSRHLTADLAYGRALVGLGRFPEAERLLAPQFETLIEDQPGARNTRRFGERWILVLEAAGLPSRAEEVRRRLTAAGH